MTSGTTPISIGIMVFSFRVCEGFDPIPLHRECQSHVRAKQLLNQ